MLYLLHGYNGDQDYFKGLYDLAGVMDELITSGQIQPMIVATPNATNNLGGSFYTNSPEFNGQSYAGRMQDFITNEVVHVVDSVFNTKTDRLHRGLAGHSMGGYGAVKLAMLRNDLFGSAASMSGVLVMQGVLPMLPVVFAENGFTPGDTAAFYRITPGPGKRLTDMMFAMASAFSPHDPANPDTSVAHRFTTNQFAGYVDLPFNVLGEIDSTVWMNHWMTNDVTAIFASGAAGVFDSTALYFDAGDHDDLGLNQQAAIFDELVTGAGKTHTFQIYSGFDDFYAADHVSMISERVKEVAKFSDRAFNR